jgi:MbtH protein
MNNPDQYFVVVNERKEHALWPSHMPVPEGWYREGFAGSEVDCMQHVDQVWADMSPASLLQTTTA